MVSIEDHYDLKAALEYNALGYAVSELAQLLAVVEGENDGPDWHWVVLAHDGRLAYIHGGCDYTGWDCQSWCDIKWFGKDLPVAVVLEAVEDDDRGIVLQLAEQLATVRIQTWREIVAEKYPELNQPIAEWAKSRWAK